MIASAVVQTILLLSSGAFNVLLNPGNISVEMQLFSSSVVLLIGFAQGFVLLTFKVMVKSMTGWNPQFGTNLLFSPLSTAMGNAINDRPGEIDVTASIVTQKGTGSVHDGFDTDDEDDNRNSEHFMPELEMVIQERRNVYSDIYLLGIATFTATYCIDTVAPTPTTAFLSGLMIMSIFQSVNIVVILARANGGFIDNELAYAMRSKRLLTVTSCVFAAGAFVMFCIGLANSNVDASSVNSLFDGFFSIFLPLITPWLLVAVSPKQQPMRTLFECTPFVATICVCFTLFFLATRGQISTIIRDLSSASNDNANITQLLLPNSEIEFKFHSDVNASLHFNMDFGATNSVGSAGNVIMLLIAPLVKIPTIIIVLANVINRSNLVVITALLVTMSLREIVNNEEEEATGHVYMISLMLSILSLFFNVLKYFKMPKWATDPRNIVFNSNAVLSNRSSQDVYRDKDLNLNVDEFE